MNNPFEDDQGEEQDYDDSLSDGEDQQSEHMKALMKAQLEISPLVPFVPPMPGEADRAKQGPKLSMSGSAASRTLLLKKRKFDANQDAEVGFADIEQTTKAHEKKPRLDNEFATLPPPGGQEKNAVPESFGSPTVEVDGGSQAALPSSADLETSELQQQSTGAEKVHPNNFSQDSVQRDNELNGKIVGGDSNGVSQSNHKSAGLFGDTEESQAATTTAVKLPAVSTVESKKHEAAQPKLGKTSPPKGVENHPTTSPLPDSLISSTEAKKVKKPKFRILVGRREREAAMSFCQDRVDLLKFLPKEDCIFLAEECWIFTKEQLFNVLGGLVETNPSDDCGPPETSRKAAFVVVRRLVDRIRRNSETPVPREQTMVDGSCKKSPDVVQSSDGRNPSDQTNYTANTAEAVPSTAAFEHPPKHCQVVAVSAADVQSPKEKTKVVPKESSPERTDEAAENPFNVQKSMSASNSEPENLSDLPADFARQAISQLNEWRDLINSKSSENTSLEDSFPFNGPISFLIPAHTRNFLATAKISSLYNFFSTRRTETGAIVDMLGLWRKKNHIVEISRLSMSKHLLAVSTRLETALASPLPVEPSARKFVISEMIIMTGAAKEFLVDRMSFYSADSFLQSRTKALAGKLAEWREEHGMPLLKGSGKVAMISSWKSNAREERDISRSPGSILPDLDLLAECSSDVPIIVDETTVKRSKSESKTSGPKSKSPPPDRVRSSDRHPLRSSDRHSLSSVEQVLGKDVADLLSKVDVRSKQDLEELDEGGKSGLFAEMKVMNLASDESGCNDTLDGWISSLKKHAKDFPERPPTSKVSAVKRKTSELGADPFDYLSSATKQFLRSIGIETGEEFLTSRTTDIAADFVNWRVQHGKPELKGLGAIASVSGWKAQCRKAARDLNLDNIAVLEPDGRVGVSPPGPKPKKVKISRTEPRKSVFQMLPSIAASEFKMKDLLSGDASRRFFVQRHSGASKAFHFELSLRKAQEDESLGLYLKYQGSAPVSTHRTPTVTEERLVIAPIRSSEQACSVPLLVTCTGVKVSGVDDRCPFQDTGFIDLSPYGVLPVEKQDTAALKAVVIDFILGTSTRMSVEWDFSKHVAPNVFVQRHGQGHRYCLRVLDAVEKGQVRRLQFPLLAALLHEWQRSGKGTGSRAVIEDACLLLSQDDLCGFLLWLRDEINGVSQLSTLRGDATHFTPEILRSRRRLHWVTRIVLSLIKTLPDELQETKDLFFQGPCQHDEQSKITISEQVKEELLSTLDRDSVCGINARSSFCDHGKNMFDQCCKEVISCYQLPPEETIATFPQRMEKVFESFLNIKETLHEKGGLELSHLFQRKDSKLFLMCEDSSSPESIVSRSRDEIDSAANASPGEKPRIAEAWYKDLLFSIGKHVLCSFHKILDAKERDRFEVATIIESIQTKHLGIGEERIQRDVVKNVLFTFDPVPLRAQTPLVPESNQFFLGIVWPVLREQGWRLEAGDLPDEVLYFPPRIGDKKRTATLKKEGGRRRLRMAREIDKLGWGLVQKLTKRLVLSFSACLADEESDGLNDSLSASIAQVKDALASWIQDGLPENKESVASQRVAEITSALVDCFSHFAPFMHEDAWPTLPNGTELSQSYRAGHLLQFLLVLPGVLRQTDLSLQEISDAMQVIQDITNFISLQYESLLDERFLPPTEHYSDESPSKKSIMAERLGLMLPRKQEVDTEKSEDGAAKEASSNEMTELILEEDKATLTDFVVRVMEQFVPTRATEKDTFKKFRRIHVGFPGLICRSCFGLKGEGRYFFTSIESLTTASTVLEKHILKCPEVPQAVKTSVVEARVTHPHQRKFLVTGSQQAYFNRLWDRLRSKKIGGQAMNIQTSSIETSTSLAEEEASSDPLLEFRHHIEIMDYLRTRNPWKTNKTVQNAVGKYYSSLDYVGRIYQTPSMPKHFSSEWLLAKVCPKKYVYAKSKSLPG